jgi:hypothetical protein
MKIKNFKLSWAEDRKGIRNIIVIHKCRQYLFATATDLLTFLYKNGAGVKDRLKAGKYVNTVFRLKGEKPKC